MVEVNRRGFLAAAATAAVAAMADDEKLTDGGFADVTLPGVPPRTTPLVPPGADGIEAFARRCVGCQLCVTQCQNHVLRPLAKRHPGAPLEATQPVMGFERGYCRPECTACGDVCPAGAIRRLSPQQKRKVRAGHAVWNKDACLAASEGVACHACERHCLGNAIALVPMDPGSKKSPMVPKIDETKCIGCGACEHLCPARPMPAITVEGLPRHATARDCVV